MEKLIHMIVRNSLNKKEIRSVALILSITFSSCSSIKNSENDAMTYYLEDFIKSYKSYDFEEPLEVMMISTRNKNSSIEYIINEAPEIVYLGDLNNLKEGGKHNILMGTYKGILCKIQSDNIQNYRHIFNDLDESVLKKAKETKMQNDDNGNTYSFDLSLLNWNPELTIRYNSKNKKKDIILNN